MLKNKNFNWLTNIWISNKIFSCYRSYLILGSDSEAAPGYLAIGPSSVVLEWKDEWSLRMKRFQRRARKCSWIEPEAEYVKADFNFVHLERYRFLYKLYSLLKFLTFFGIML